MCVQSGAVYTAANREVRGTDGTWMRPTSEHGADVHTSHVLPGRLAWRASRPRLAPRRILSPSVSQDDLLTQSRCPPPCHPVHAGVRDSKPCHLATSEVVVHDYWQRAPPLDNSICFPCVHHLLSLRKQMTERLLLGQGFLARFLDSIIKIWILV